jgi:hypothetical protein
MAACCSGLNKEPFQPAGSFNAAICSSLTPCRLAEAVCARVQ